MKGLKMWHWPKAGRDSTGNSAHLSSDMADWDWSSAWACWWLGTGDWEMGTGDWDWDCNWDWDSELKHRLRLREGYYLDTCVTAFVFAFRNTKITQSIQQGNNNVSKAAWCFYPSPSPSSIETCHKDWKTVLRVANACWVKLKTQFKAVPMNFRLMFSQATIQYPFNNFIAFTEHLNIWIPAMCKLSCSVVTIWSINISISTRKWFIFCHLYRKCGLSFSKVYACV